MYIHLVEVREKRGMSVKELSELSGISEWEIRKIENNRINPSVELILRLAKVLDIKINNELFTGRDIYFLRRVKKISLRDLEKLSGVSRTQINNIERGIKTPSIVVMCKLLKALDVEIDNELFSSDNEIKKE